MRECQICTNFVMDTTDSEITFDEKSELFSDSSKFNIGLVFSILALFLIW